MTGNNSIFLLLTTSWTLRRRTLQSPPLTPHTLPTSRETDEKIMRPKTNYISTPQPVAAIKLSAFTVAARQQPITLKCQKAFSRKILRNSIDCLWFNYMPLAANQNRQHSLNEEWTWIKVGKSILSLCCGAAVAGIGFCCCCCCARIFQLGKLKQFEFNSTFFVSMS